MVWLILFGSKFLIFEVINLVFSDYVEQRKFLDVILLVIALMVAREDLSYSWPQRTRMTDSTSSTTTKRLIILALTVAVDL